MILKSFKDLIYLKEMATVRRENGYKITIFPEPLGNPSFHLYYKNEWEVVLTIKDFTILEVKTKLSIFKKNGQLPNYIKKDLLEILNHLHGKLTTWEFLVLTWNVNNPNYEIDLNTEIPGE